MLRRLRVYFTGFGIGLIIVVVMFWRDDSRDLDIWMPEQRILEDIRLDSVFLNDPKLRCYQNCFALSETDMARFWTDSKTKSLNPGGDPYRYLITMANDDKHIEAEIEWDKTKRTLLAFRDKKNPKDCKCE